MKRFFSLIFGLFLFAIQALDAQTIGNNANGTTTDVLWYNGAWINSIRYQAPTNMTITNIMARITSITGKYKVAVYSDNSSLPRNLLQSSAEVVNPSANGWYSFPLISPLSLTNNQYYWFAIWSDGSGAQIYYTSGGTVRWGRYDYGNWPNPISTTGGESIYNYCIYATNTISEVVSNPPPPITNANCLATVTLAWDASPDSTVTGYKLYHGVSTRSYTNVYNVGNVLTGTLSNLVCGTTYYFAATAYNGLGTESVYSDELVYTIPSPTNQPPVLPNPPTNARFNTN